jgi:hypothetical protein
MIEREARLEKMFAAGAATLASAERKMVKGA